MNAMSPIGPKRLPRGNSVAFGTRSGHEPARKIGRIGQK